MRRLLAALLLVVLAFVLVPAPRTDAQQKTLVITGYGGRWSEVMKKALVEPFEKKHNVKIEVVTGITTEWVAKLMAAGPDNPPYDVVFGNEPPFPIPRERGFFEKRNEALAPNIKNLYPKALIGDTSLAMFWGRIGLAYRTDSGVKKPTSWKDWWDDAYSGRRGTFVIGNTLGLNFLFVSSKLHGKDSFHHYIRFFSDSYYVGVLWDTLVLGLITTAIALLLGYPIAYHLSFTSSRWKPLLIVFILSPLLVGIVIRCYGWMILLADRGLINATLAEHGWITRPLPLMYNKFGVTLALVHVFLPFMVLSLTGVLKRIDPQLIEASKTLGASPRRAFFEVTLPLSLPGILAGSLLVFSLAISSFVVPILLGGFKVHVLPMIVYEQVLSVFDWPFGAANAFVLLVISLALIAVYIKVTERALRGIV